MAYVTKASDGSTEYYWFLFMVERHQDPEIKTGEFFFLQNHQLENNCHLRLTIYSEFHSLELLNKTPVVEFRKM